MNYNFRVFISSTFDDFAVERNLLKEIVWPEIESYCQKRGATFQAIDLRWGIPPELADTLDVVNICLDEVKNCKKLSPTPNFISLIGNRYGWRPLPKKVPSEVLNSCIRDIQCSEKDRKTVLEHYTEDKNAIPSEYILNEQISDKNYENLLDILRKLSKNNTASKKYFDYSATHQEILEGILLEHTISSDNYFSAFRTIDKLQNNELQDDILKKYTDTIILRNGMLTVDKEASSLLNELRKKIRSKLEGKSEQIIDYSSTLDSYGVIKVDKDLELFCIKIEKWLKKVIDKELKRLYKIDPLTFEIESHQVFLNERIKEYHGRRELVELFESNLVSSDSLCISGDSGTGKSTAMAKFVSRRLSNGKKNTLIIYRFIGATPKSVNINTLLESIIYQLQKELNITTEVVGDIFELSLLFQELLEKATSLFNIILFLDALDQLEDKNDSWTLSWIPKAVKNFKIIVSVVSTTVLFGNYKRVVYQKGYINSNTIELNTFKLNQEEVSEIVDHLLKLRLRKVTLEQKAIILNNYSKSTNSMLFLKLAVIITSKWRSFDSQEYILEKKLTLKHTTSELIQSFFNYLASKENHGLEFVLSVLALISNSRYGISEKELLEITWKNEKYQAEFESRKHPSQPNVDKIPSFIWSKLYFDLEPFLMFRSYDKTLLLGFFHRVFLEEAKKFTLIEKEYTHRLLFEYFNNQKISPFYFVDFQGNSIINRRKITELPYNLALNVQYQTQFEEKISEIYLNFHFLFSKVILGRVYELIEDFINLGDIKNKTGFENINLIYKALRQDVTFIQRHPSLLLQSLWNRCWWHDNPRINSFTKNNIKIIEKEKFLYEYLEAWKDTMLVINPHFQWLRSLRPPTTSLNGSQLEIYRGQPSPVCFVRFTLNEQITSICNIGDLISWDIKSQKSVKNIKLFNDKSFMFRPNSKTKFTYETEIINDGGGVLADHPGFEYWASYGISNEMGNKFISGSGDGTVFLIEITDSEIIRQKLYTHDAPVRSLKFSHNENFLVSGAGDGSVKLYAFKEKKLITTVNHIDGWVNSVAVMDDGKQIISAGGDCYLYIWQLEDNVFVLKQKLLEHKDRVWCLALSKDEKYIATGSDDKSVILWEWDSSDKKFKYFYNYEIHTRWVQTITFNQDGSLLASSGGDGKIAIWNTKQNNLAYTLKGHDDSVLSLDFAKNKDLLVSGSRDRTVRLWDINNYKLDNEIDEHDERIECAVYSKDGNYLATASSDGSVLIRYSENDLIFSSFQCSGRVVTLDFTSNNLGIVYGSKNNIIYKDLTNNKESIFSENIKSLNEEIECLKVSFDDKYIISAHKCNNNGILKLWRLSDHKLLHIVTNLEGDYILDLAISNERENIVCSSKNGYIYCYQIENHCIHFKRKRKVFETWADGVFFSKDSKFVELRGGSWYKRETVIIDFDSFENEISRKEFDSAIGSFNEYPLNIRSTEISVQQKDKKSHIYYPGTLEFSIMHPNKRQWIGVQRYNHVHIRLEGGE